MKQMLLILLLASLSACSQPDTDGNTYAYGSALILKDGVYYNYYCAMGSSGWDDTRLQTSTDLVNWTPPRIMMTAPYSDLAACDPSVVKLNEYYYLIYGGLDENVTGAIYISRSKSLNGPFEKYSNGVWDNNRNPSTIVRSTVSTKLVYNYGAGQPTVVNRNGTLYMWYTDTTYQANWCTTLLVKSTDGINWTAPVPTSLGVCSVDIKYNISTNKFVMFGLQGMHTSTVNLQVLESDDGITFHVETLRMDITPFANNPGVSGDEYGNLISDPFVTYGAPQDFALTDRWGFWDMYMTNLGTGLTTQIVRTHK